MLIQLSMADIEHMLPTCCTDQVASVRGDISFFLVLSSVAKGAGVVYTSSVHHHVHLLFCLPERRVTRLF